MNSIDHKIVLSLFAGYTIKALALGANINDAAVILVLAAAHFLYNSQIQNKQISQLNQLVEGMKSELDSVKKTQDDLKTSIASVKISTGLHKVK